MILKSRVFDGSGPDIILLHGMFASKENFLTIARGLSDFARVLVPDLRNHGESFHADEMDYPLMAADVAGLMESEGIDNAWLLGHSMGGKVAMELALTSPKLVKGLIVEDIAPRMYADGLVDEINAMQNLPLGEITRRSDAEDWMYKLLGNRDVAGFLLKNLVRRAAGGFDWRMNLEVLQKNMPLLRDFPAGRREYSGPVLFIRGENSDYFGEGDYDSVKTSFPSARIETIPGASHWVHAEKPAEVISLINSCIM